MATVSIDQAFINAGTPLAYNTTYTFVEDVTMSVPFTFVNTGDPQSIIVDGNSHTITVNTPYGGWSGLFSRAVSVQNLGILSEAQLYGSNGWFFSSSVGGRAMNCYSTGSLIEACGGIFGSQVPMGTIAINCYSTGAIISPYIPIFSPGGIFGSMGQGTAINCYSTGSIGSNCGGIFGANSNAGTIMRNCYSAGGSNLLGVNSSQYTVITNSGTSSGWSDTSANQFLIGTPGTTYPIWYSNETDMPYKLITLTGGIDQAFIDAGTPLADYMSYWFVENVNMSVPFTFVNTDVPQNITVDGKGHTITVIQDNWPGLFSKGAIRVYNLGILSTCVLMNSAGWFTPYNKRDGEVYAENCYSTGAIGSFCGGIIGSNSTGNAVNCYSTGTISSYAGGIFGSNVYGGRATNCYSSGTTYGAGIFGEGCISPTINNCYCANTVNLVGGESTNIRITNSGGSSSGWSDASANQFLTGTPGTTPQIWYSNGTNVPYVLTQPASYTFTSLSDLVINSVSVSAPYSITLDANAASVSITAIATNSAATVSFGDISGTGTITSSLVLGIGVNTFSIGVIAQDGTTTGSTTFTVTNPAPASGNATTYVSNLLTSTNITKSSFDAALSSLISSGTADTQVAAPSINLAPIITNYASGYSSANVSSVNTTFIGTNTPSEPITISTPSTGDILYLTGASGTYVLQSEGSSSSTTITFTPSEITVNGSPLVLGDTVMIGHVIYVLIATGTLVLVAANAPDAPTNVVASEYSTSTVLLTWDAPANNGHSNITGYTIKTSAGINVNKTVISRPTPTSARITGLSLATPYQYKVAAGNAVGISSYTTSNVVTLYPAPAAPTLSAIQCGDGLVNLIWNQPNNNGSEITSYKVYSRPSTTIVSTLVSSNINFIGTTAVVSGLTNLATYYFQVSAVNAGGESVKSSVISGKPGIIPGAPQNVTGVAGNTKVTLSWSPPSVLGTPSLTSYYVYMSSTSSGSSGSGGAGGAGGSLGGTPGGGGGQTIDTSYTKVNIITVTGTSVTVPKLTNGTAYTFKVSAYNGIGEGSQSAASSSITPAQPPSATVPSAPQLLNAVAGDSSVTLTWTAPISDGGASVTSYKVYNSNNTINEITTNITRPTSTSATITGLTNGTSKSYIVKAVNTAGAGASATSPSVTPNSLITNISSTLSTLSSTPNISATVASLISSTSPTNNTSVPSQSTADAQTYVGVQVMTQTNQQTLGSTAMDLVTNMFTQNTSANNTTTVLSLINTINQLNTNGQSTAVTSLATALVTVGNGTSVILDSSQTTSLLSNKQNVSNPPSTLQVIVPPTSNILTLSTTTGVYLSLVPGVQYTVNVPTNKSTSTAYLTYNASTQQLALQTTDTGTITNYAVGSSIQIGAYQYQIFTVGSGGLNPQGDVTDVVASTTTNSATVTWTNPTIGSTFSNKITVTAGGVTTTYTQAGVSGASASKTISGLAPGTVVSFTVTTVVDGEESNDVTVSTTVPSGTVPCFPTGTRILTPSGYKQVEDLVQNELVVTAEGRHVPVKIYGRKFSHATKQIAPFMIPKSALGRNMPSHSLTLSPDHAFLIRKGVWMLPSRAALLSDAVTQVGVGSPVAYYHLECPNYLRDNLVVDGVVVESYAANQLNCKSPYTYNENLKGYTRASPAISTKNTLSL